MSDSLKDRGTIKWTSMMLPEHVKMVKEVFAEGDQVERPIIDEQQKMENDLVLQAALHDDLEVEIKYYADNKINRVKGRVLFIDTFNGVLRLDGPNMDLKIEDIMEVKL